MKTTIVMTIETEREANTPPNAVGILLRIEEAVAQYRLALARSEALSQMITDDRVATYINVEVTNA